MGACAFIGIWASEMVTSKLVGGIDWVQHHDVIVCKYLRFHSSTHLQQNGVYKTLNSGQRFWKMRFRWPFSPNSIQVGGRPSQRKKISVFKQKRIHVDRALLVSGSKNIMLIVSREQTSNSCYLSAPGVKIPDHYKHFWRGVFVVPKINNLEERSLVSRTEQQLSYLPTASSFHHGHDNIFWRHERQLLTNMAFNNLFVATEENLESNTE